MKNRIKTCWNTVWLMRRWGISRDNVQCNWFFGYAFSVHTERLLINYTKHIAIVNLSANSRVYWLCTYGFYIPEFLELIFWFALYILVRSEFSSILYFIFSRHWGFPFLPHHHQHQPQKICCNRWMLVRRARTVLMHQIRNQRKNKQLHRLRFMS